MVLIHKPDTPRGLWPKGVITEAIAGIDNLVRTVTIRTVNGEVERDVCSVCLLEGADD